MNGSKKMDCRVSLCVVLLCSISSSLAEEITNDEQQTAPSIDFLEFLGEWETEQGEWIDPETLKDKELTNLIDTTVKLKKNNEN